MDETVATNKLLLPAKGVVVLEEHDPRDSKNSLKSGS